MKLDPKARESLDWALFNARWIFMFVTSVAIFVIQERTFQDIGSVQDIILAVVVGGAANLVYLLLIFVPALRREYGLPIVYMIGDWLMAAFFVNLSQGHPVLLIGITGTLVVGGMMRLRATVGALHVGGILAAAGISLVFTLGSEVVLDSLMTYVPLVVFVALMATVIGMLVYKLEEETRIARKRIAKTAEEQTEQLGEMRARADAVSEMATTLSATRNFEKILDETLNIGNLGWRKTSRERGVSMVLLVRSHDEKLYVATSRGLRHQDQHRVISGRTGIVAEAFDEGLPVIGGDLDDDPDLSQFIGMSGMRSTLCIPLRAGYDTFGALLYASDAEDAFSEDQIVTLHAIATQATVAMQNAVLYNSLLQEKERLIQIEEDARKALVRDLHDVPAQSIMTVVMKIRIIQRYLEGTVEQQREVPNELKSVEELALRANEEIRHVLFKLRPLALESQGLTVALNQLADKMQETYDQTVKIRVGKGLERLLDTSQQGALFYLVEEAVNNARKYAEASQISVAVGRQGQLLVIRIQDNGKGFDAQAVNANYNERGSFGMVNMRERAELLDGTLSLESALGKGTTITVSIPIASLERERQMAEPRQIAAPTTKLAATAMRQFERSRPRVTP